MSGEPISDAVWVALITGATTAVATIATFVLGLAQILKKVEEVHKQTNSKMDQLLETTAAASLAKGKLEEANDESLRKAAVIEAQGPPSEPFG